MDYLPKMLVDTNAACMEAAIDVVFQYAEYAPPGFISRYTDAWFPAIVDKTFNAKATLCQRYCNQTLCII